MKMRKAAGLLLTFALVFAAAFGGMSAETQAASRIRLNRNTLTMTKGERFRLRVRNLPEGARVTWKSSNRRRATVSQNGVVRARKAGTVTIRSRVRFERDGERRTRTFTCRVRINKKSARTNSLVVYFSMPETDENTSNVDAATGASITTSGGRTMGNVQYAASVIWERTHSDIFRIRPQVAYPTRHTPLVNQASREQDQDARPAIRNRLRNLSQYDTIYVCYPIWWSDMPQIMYTFFDSYDFSGKTIIPLVVHGGSGFSGTVGRIRNLEPGATVSDDGLSIYRDNIGRSQSRIINWLNQ